MFMAEIFLVELVIGLMFNKKDKFPLRIALVALFLAAITTGRATYPPFENTTSGLNRSRIAPAFLMPENTLKGIAKFSGVKLRDNLAQGTP